MELMVDALEFGCLVGGGLRDILVNEADQLNTLGLQSGQGGSNTFVVLVDF